MKLTALLLTIALPLFGQINQDNQYNFINAIHQLHNDNTRQIVIRECEQYLQSHFPEAQSDQVLYVLSQLQIEDRDYSKAFSNLMLIKFLFPTSTRVQDAIVTVNQIILNHDPDSFENSRSTIVGIVTRPLPQNSRMTAYQSWLKLLDNLDFYGNHEIFITEVDRYLELALEADTETDYFLFRQARHYEQLSKWYHALSSLTKIRYLTPQSKMLPLALYQQGQIEYRELDHYNDAITTFSSLSRQYPADTLSATALFAIAEIKDTKQDAHQEAVTAFQQLAERYPEHRLAVPALKRAAEILQDESDYTNAAGAWYHLFERYPDSAEAPAALLNCEYLYRRKLDNYRKACEILELYATHYSNREDAAERLFDAANYMHEDVEDQTAAVILFEKVVKRFPQSGYSEKAQDKLTDIQSAN